jgi:hypothetical protein
MSYISTLPKDLRSLVEFYANYQWWQYLSDVFSKLSSGTMFAPGENVFFEYYTCELKKLFPDCRIDTQIDDSTDKIFNMTLVLPIDKLVTQELFWGTAALTVKVMRDVNSDREIRCKERIKYIIEEDRRAIQAGLP